MFHTLRGAIPTAPCSWTPRRVRDADSLAPAGCLLGEPAVGPGRRRYLGLIGTTFQGDLGFIASEIASLTGLTKGVVMFPISVFHLRPWQALKSSTLCSQAPAFHTATRALSLDPAAQRLREGPPPGPPCSLFSPQTGLLLLVQERMENRVRLSWGL